MQVKKSYTETVTAGTNAYRTFSYGMTNTMSLNAATDYFNQKVADFLQECGVDAAYEARGDVADKYLWIRGVPFLFVYGYNSGTKKYGYAVYAPGSTTAVVTQCAIIFNGSTLNASFSLLFTGNSDTGFTLRWTSYGGASIESIFFTCYKAKNMLTGKTSTVWRWGIFGTSYETAGSFNAVDLDEDGNFNREEYSTQLFYAKFLLTLKNITNVKHPGKLLLVPVQIGNHILEGVYQTPSGCLPTPVTWSTEQQTEVEIGGRKFLVTCYAPALTFTEGSHAVASLTVNTNYMNMGLVEVTDT